MAEIFSFFAEEISSAIAVVWGGFAIASELNYRLMTVIITSMSRIVQLLFLLTQKVADVFSIIAGDILLFIGDIGTGTMAFIHLFRNLGTSVISFIMAVMASVGSSVYYIFQLVYSVYNNIFYVLTILESSVCQVFVIIRDVCILTGSSIIFMITFIPNLIYFLMREAVYALHSLQASFRITTLQVFAECIRVWKQSFDSFVNYFTQIPLEAVAGIIVGTVAIMVIKASLRYLPDNVVPTIDVNASAFFSNVKEALFSWYSRMRNDAIAEPANRHNINVDPIDDGNDENGNDNNQNIPDRNLERDPIAPPTPPTNNIDPPLVRRPITRHQRRLGLQRDTSDDEIAARRKSPSSRLAAQGLSASSDNITDKLQKQLEEERDNQLCVICQDRRKNIILLPCRHLCLCSVCSLFILRRDEPCPICRKIVAETLKVFL